MINLLVKLRFLEGFFLEPMRTENETLFLSQFILLQEAIKRTRPLSLWGSLSSLTRIFGSLSLSASTHTTDTPPRPQSDHHPRATHKIHSNKHHHQYTEHHHPHTSTHATTANSTADAPPHPHHRQGEEFFSFSFFLLACFLVSCYLFVIVYLLPLLLLRCVIVVYIDLLRLLVCL